MHTYRGKHKQLLKPDTQWLSAPGECSADFLPTFGPISCAVQFALRERLPLAYFQRLEEFRDRQKANAVLLFQASPPFRAKVRTDLTYDVLDSRTLVILTRKAKPGLTHLLSAVEAKLRAADQAELAGQYAPRRVVDIIASVQSQGRSRRCLLNMIRAEGVLVDALVQLGGSRDLSARKQKARVASFCKKWNFQLRHICTGKDLTCLAPAVLEAATKALASFQQVRPRRARA